MPQDIKLSLDRLETISREIEPKLPAHRAWAVIYPFVHHCPDTAYQQIRFRVRIVEIPTEELRRTNDNLDGDESFIVDRVNVVVETEEQIINTLDYFGVECERFTSSFHSGLPF